MTRRTFLAALAGLTLDPERLLWRPGAKLISIPKPTTGGLFNPHADIAAQYAAIYPKLLRFHPDSFVLRWPAVNYDVKILS